MAITPRTANVFIYQGDDLQRLAELRQVADTRARIHRAAQQANARVGDDTVTPMKAAQAAADAFVDEVAERAEVIVVRALGRRQWRDLVVAHPPRRIVRVVDGAEQDLLHEDDADYNVNTSTFPDALVTYIDPTRPEMRTVVTPEFPTVQGLRDYLDDMSGGDFDLLWVTAFYLNSTHGSDPQSSRYSASSPISQETSE